MAVLRLDGPRLTVRSATRSAIAGKRVGDQEGSCSLWTVSAFSIPGQQVAEEDLERPALGSRQKYRGLPAEMARAPHHLCEALVPNSRVMDTTVFDPVAAYDNRLPGRVIAGVLAR